MYEVAWQEFNREERIVSKRKEFKTAEAASRFIDRISAKDNFYSIIGYRQERATA